MKRTTIVSTLAMLVFAMNATAHPPEVTGGPNDFDFEFGAWTVELSRLVAPLSGSNEWVQHSGTSVVRRVWDGRANLGELDVDGPGGKIQGMSLRLYVPEARQWHVRWANSRTGLLGETPMVGGFDGGEGLFYGRLQFQGREIIARFIFDEMTEDTFRIEQAFSVDDGHSWEPNWIARFRRVADGR